MIRSIVLYGDPILKTKLPPLVKNSISREELLSLVKDLRETMVAHNGVGIAANQIGRQERLFLVGIGNTDPNTCFINPEIIERFGESVCKNEGCLSIPGAYCDSDRYESVTLKWLDHEWKAHQETFDGFFAQIVQHEVDHLNGLLYIDHFKPLKKQLLIDKYKKHIRQLKKI